MNKKTALFVDDVIWVFRDIARKRPESIWDNTYMKMLKKAHDKYSAKIQLNLFYRTSFWYSDDDFSLSDMPDIYKSEFEEASDWLKLAFHSKEEWPDYPFINADYDVVDRVFKLIKNEVVRFAGEQSFAKSVVTHWIPMSKDGVRALADNGVVVTYASYGDKSEWDGNMDSLPYGHSFRLIHNRKPESGVYTKFTRDTAISNALCAYNHIDRADYERIEGRFATVKDKEFNISYMPSARIILNLVPLDMVEDEIKKYIHQEYFNVGNHEQYFYPDYYAYQPDYAQKLLLAAKTLYNAGYEFIFMEELPH